MRPFFCPNLEAVMGVCSATLNYGDWDISRPTIQSGKAHFIIAGRTGVWRPIYDGLQDRGIRLVQYLNHIDIGPNRQPYAPWERDWCFNAPMLPYSNWSGYAGIVKLDAAWVDHLVEAMKPIMTDPRVDDVMLDVDGERLWSAAWTRMTTAEKDNFAKWQRELNDRWGALRDAERPGMNLFANGTWADGHKALRPAVEHHDSELTLDPKNFWWEYVNPERWDDSGQPLAIVYASSLTAARQWAQVPGVGVVTIQQSYVSPATEYLPFGEYLPRAATPQPDPTPPPPPAGDPCADIRVELAEARAEVTRLRDELDGALDERDALRAAAATARQTLDAALGE